MGSATLLDKLRTCSSLIKLPHTVFALPFALGMLVVTSRITVVRPAHWIWLVLAMVFARTSAMTFNRIVDHRIDAVNPRTAGRDLPVGRITPPEAWCLTALSSLAFMVSAAALGTHCLIAAPAVLGVLFFYSWTKRFTTLSHLVLGFALALAPGGVWYAMTDSVSLMPIVLMSAVLLWVAGFDIIYSCQDHAFDRQMHLYSIPAKLGIASALRLSRFMHVICAALLVWFGALAGLGAVYFSGILVFTVALASQHWVVHGADLSRADSAFFSRNGLASILFFLSVFIDHIT